ncbi:hypothetical protein BT96DRAFT_998459 [Gymnopus androsaceus JB14]|uniref:Uncharacterized protein n=1 Tax=Gymnopus androsaceus JB14 TaxID=1447944 RepID=A0A6A4H9X9_9AGAR|nr:hypothetical protein BT96DRAFT_998459 [Gymnopus androsaceus JB14]
MSDLIMMDPSLLTPAQHVMRDMALQQLSKFDSDVPGPKVPPNEGQSAHDLQAPSAAEPSLHAMAAQANMAKIELELSPKYGAILDKYIHASTAEQRLLAVAYTLKTAQQLEEAMKAERYTISDGLKKSLRTYAMLFIMSPHLSSFRGPVADTIIVHFMPGNEQILTFNSI